MIATLRQEGPLGLRARLDALSTRPMRREDRVLLGAIRKVLRIHTQDLTDDPFQLRTVLHPYLIADELEPETVRHFYGRMPCLRSGSASRCTSGDAQLQIQGPDGPIFSLALSWDDQTLAIGNRKGDIHLFNSYTGKHLSKWSGHTQSVRDLGWNADGTLLYSGSDDHSIRIWRRKDGECIHHLKVTSGPFERPPFHPMGNGCCRVRMTDNAECGISSMGTANPWMGKVDGSMQWPSDPRVEWWLLAHRTTV